jgi:hypothetical protein
MKGVAAMLQKDLSSYWSEEDQEYVGLRAEFFPA